MDAAASIIMPITALVTNDDEAVEIERLDLTIKSSEEPRTATLERIWIDDVRPRPGRTVPLKILMHTYRGQDVLAFGADRDSGERDWPPVGDRLGRSASGTG